MHVFVHLDGHLMWAVVEGNVSFPSDEIMELYPRHVSVIVKIFFSLFALLYDFLFCINIYILVLVLA